MSKIISARAYANNEIAVVAWSVTGPIEGCLGFELTRMYPDSKEETVLAAWVPFKGQRNPDWKPQNTSVWPVQKLMWRDLTVRKKRDAADRRPADVNIKYRIRPLVKAIGGLKAITGLPDKSYTGDPIPLAYLDEGAETNEVLVTGKFGDIDAAFTNGILSAQWLRAALKAKGQDLTQPVVTKHIQTPGDDIRSYLTGDVLDLLRELLERASQEKNAHVRLALYELTDQELNTLLLKNSDKIDLILSNTSKSKSTGKYDAENLPFRKALAAKLGARLTNRMFNNGRIGHNKFAVYVGADGKPKAVLTGSTNWTPTGLCGQSNNAMIVESPALAQQYYDYWDRLKKDTAHFKTPSPQGASTTNAQGPEIRAFDAKEQPAVILADKTSITMWCAPNTKATSKNAKVTPPDLAALYALMAKAQKAIFFGIFMPSRSGLTSVIEQAITLGKKNSDLLVYGTISDPTAMPNYVAPPPKKKGDAGARVKAAEPATFDQGHIHIVRAAALVKDDLVGDFEAELLKVGQAIIHDKIVVVDPLSPEGFVAMGSHNMGFKASYENDENMLIIRNNPKLVQAYAMHIVDLYEHYRYRSVLLEQKMAAAKSGKKSTTPDDGFDGFLSITDAWLKKAMTSNKDDVAAYLSGEK